MYIYILSGKQYYQSWQFVEKQIFIFFPWSSCWKLSLKDNSLCRLTLSSRKQFQLFMVFHEILWFQIWSVGNMLYLCDGSLELASPFSS